MKRKQKFQLFMVLGLLSMGQAARAQIVKVTPEMYLKRQIISIAEERTKILDSGVEGKNLEKLLAENAKRFQLTLEICDEKIRGFKVGKIRFTGLLNNHCELSLKRTVKELDSKDRELLTELEDTSPEALKEVIDGFQQSLADLKAKDKAKPKLREEGNEPDVKHEVENN